MAEGLNKVMLLGNLGADPELKTTQNSSVLKLRIATTEGYFDRDRVWQERTEWHSVAVWGKRGEALSKFMKKGDRVFIEGGLRTSSYEKDGEKRYRTEVNAMNVILCGGSRKDAGSRGAAEGSARGAGEAGGGVGGGGGGDPFQDFGEPAYGGDDDIPFIYDAGRSGRRDRP